MKTEITKHEVASFERCQETINKTKKSFVDCGLALAEIRDGKLYRHKFETFEDFCQKDHGWGRQHAYHLIDAAEALKCIPIGIQIKNLSQARAIAAIPEGKRQEILEKAKELGELTARTIKEASIPEKTVHLDKIGRHIPDSILEDWKRAEQNSGLSNRISELKCHLEERLKDEDIVFGEINNSIISELKSVFGSLRRLIPHAVCPSCQGHQRKKCTLCKRRGFISKFMFETCVPEETKSILSKSK